MNKMYLIILILFTVKSYGMVNLATGHLYYKTSVLEIKDVKLDIWKAYNSGQKFTGLFGKRWCSNLDIELKKTNNSYKLIKCGVMSDLYKKSNKIYKGKYGSLQLSKQSNSVFINGNKEFTFYKNGQLRSMHYKNQYLFLRYTNGSIVIENNYKKKIQFKLNKGKVAYLKFNNKILRRYIYRKNFLFQEFNVKSKMIRYSFNNKQNLQKIILPKGKYLEVKYNKYNLVTALKKPKNCSETFNYKNIGKIKFKVSSENKCGNKTLTKRIHHLQGTQDNKYQSYFSPQIHKKISYNPKTKTIKQYKNKSESKDYKYNSKKQITELHYQSYTKDFKSKIKYNKKGKISKIQYRNSKNTANLKTVNLSYDKLNQLKFMRTSDGKKYKVTYKGPYLKSIESKNSKLSYKYNKNRNLASVVLNKNGKKVQHILGKKNRIKNSNEVSKYLGQFYESMGPLYDHSYVLREVIR